MLSFLFFLFIIVVAIQIGYYGFLFRRFSFLKNQDIDKKSTPVSVLIACRNEEENLEVLVPKLLLQDHPDFEIVLVNDASTDNTLTILENFSKEIECVRVLSIPKTDFYQGNKKNALTQAIKLAKNEHLLFTDADCIPSSNSWISEMASGFTDEKQLILGYGGYEKNTGLLNKLIRYETLLTAWQYFSYAIIGKPYMGVGRNIAYTKSLFNEAGGFQSHQDFRSGDDDLFVNQVGTVENAAICWKPKAHTVSRPKTNLSDWLKQKRRHITTATSYKLIHQLLLGFFYISQVLFYSLFFLLIIIYSSPKVILLLACIRFVFFYFSLIPAAKKLNKKDLVLYAPFLELNLILLQMRIFIINLWEKPKEW